MDTAIVVISTTTAAAAAAQLVSPEATAWRVLLLMPLIGAVVIMGGAVMLNPAMETRKITIGRALFGFLFGVGGPSALSSILEYWAMIGLQKLMLAPGVLLFEGAAIAWVAFWLSKPFCRGFYERADAMANREIRRLERLPGVAHDEPKDR